MQASSFFGTIFRVDGTWYARHEGGGGVLLPVETPDSAKTALSMGNPTISPVGSSPTIGDILEAHMCRLQKQLVGKQRENNDQTVASLVLRLRTSDVMERSCPLQFPVATMSLEHSI